MHRMGGMGLGAIERDQPLVIEHPKGAQPAVLLKALTDLQRDSIAVTRQAWSEQVASLSVPGNVLTAKQGSGIIVPLGLLERTLVIEKRRRLGVKDTKSAQGRVFDGVSSIRPWLAMVREVSDLSVQDALEILEAEGVCHGYLLMSKRRITFTMEESFGNREPLISQIYNYWQSGWFEDAPLRGALRQDALNRGPWRRMMPLGAAGARWSPRGPSREESP